MINKTRDAIIQTLYKEFGDEYKYYPENVEQSFQGQSFTVDVLNPLERSTNATTYYRTVPCVIYYFTKNKETPKRDCYAVGERAMEALEYITIDDKKVRGYDIECDMVDDALRILVTYRFWTENKPTSETGMSELETVNPTLRKD